MAVKFKFTRYDFANNLNMPESEHQERRLERLLNDGWEIQDTDLTDVYLSVLWRKGSLLQVTEPDQSARVAELEAHQADVERQLDEARAAAESRDAVIQQLTAECDQALELVRQLQARVADAPASVQVGDVPLP